LRRHASGARRHRKSEVCWTSGSERAHLIAHQRNQRRDHQSEARPGDGGKLVAQRLAAARRHHREHVLARQHSAHDFFLAGTKLAEAEDGMQQG